jgi:Domain of unknown function (DUF4258)
MGMEIGEIRAKISTGNYRFSDHAVKRMIRRSIDRIEVEEAILIGEIIEEYPDDKYSPSCLVYGVSKAGRHLHMQLSLPPAVTVITAYDPDASEWIDYRVRRIKA